MSSIYIWKWLSPLDALASVDALDDSVIYWSFQRRFLLKKDLFRPPTLVGELPGTFFSIPTPVSELPGIFFSIPTPVGEPPGIFFGIPTLVGESPGIFFGIPTLVGESPGIFFGRKMYRNKLCGNICSVYPLEWALNPNQSISTFVQTLWPIWDKYFITR